MIKIRGNSNSLVSNWELERRGRRSEGTGGAAGGKRKIGEGGGGVE